MLKNGGDLESAKRVIRDFTDKHPNAFKAAEGCVAHSLCLVLTQLFAPHLVCSRVRQHLRTNFHSAIVSFLKDELTARKVSFAGLSSADLSQVILE
jgi:hypothetical protein